MALFKDLEVQTMKSLCGAWFLFFSLGVSAVLAQTPQIIPHVLAKPELDGKVTKV